MRRLRGWDVRTSRAPGLIGLCQSDPVDVFRVLNAAQERLLYDEASGDEGWWGTWAEMVLTGTVTKTQPYFTAPREVARVDLVAVCDKARPVHSQFYEYLQFGNGRLPKLCPWACERGRPAAYTRNNAVTFTDLYNAPQHIRIFSTDPTDATNGLRVLLQGHDQNGAPVYTEDPVSGQQVNGEYVSFATPFAASAYQWQDLTGIQKDITLGVISIFQVDPTSGQQVLLLTMEPSEQTASYRRYFFTPLPLGCCNLCQGPLQVSAIVKLDLIPVQTDSDYCLIQNLEAITEEFQAMRLEEIDSTSAKAESVLHHKRAIALLNGEIRHFLGYNEPAIECKVFGSDRLRRVY